MNNTYLNTNDTYANTIAKNTYDEMFAVRDRELTTNTNTIEVVRLNKEVNEYLTNELKGIASTKINHSHGVVFEISLGSYIIPEVPSNPITHEISDNVTSVPEMIDAIKTSLGLNYSQLANVLKVSRVTIYNHLKGEGSIELYESLYELASLVAKKYESVSSILKSVKVEGTTLLKHLEKDGPNINVNKFDELIVLAMKSRPTKKAIDIPFEKQVKRHITNTKTR